MTSPRSRTPLALTTAALAALLSACAGDDAGPPALPVAPLSIEPEPSLAVGVLEGDTAQELEGVVTPFLLPDGRLVVPLAGARAIRVFSRAGELVQTLGRRGEGPGELASLDAAWARGDTIEAFDGDLRRIIRFPPRGEPETVTLEPIATAQQVIPGPLPDGWALVGVAGFEFGARDDVVVHRYARDGTHLGELARTKGIRRHTVGNMSGPDPLSPRALFAVHDGQVYMAETLTPRIRVLEPMGQGSRDVSWDPGPPPPAAQALATVVDSAAARAGEGRAEELRRRLQAFPVAERAPAFWDFRVDAQGFIWVRPYEPDRHSLAMGARHPAGGSGEWLVLAPHGEPVGRVAVPAGLEPARITVDAVVGVRRDSLGVESVRVHGLERAEPAEGGGA